MTLVEQICAAIAVWYPQFVAVRGTPYAFALYTDDGALTVVPAANVEADAVPELRFEVGEWPELAVPGDPFDAICTRLREDPRDDFPRFKQAVLDAMVDALALAKERGVFGTAPPVLFASISDSERAEALETSSRARLNPV